jgi:hypothetical protein
LNPRPHEAQLDEGEAARPTNNTKSGKTTKRARKAQNPCSPLNQLPLTLSMQALPLRYTFIIFLLSTTLLAKSSTNFVPILSPFGNELIKHQPREK